MAFSAAFAFSAAVHVASADHYHVFCNAGGAAGHGFVHGGSTTDGAWHARVETGCGNTLKYCEAGSIGQGSKGFTRSLESACDKLVYGTGYLYKDQECWGWAYLSQDARINPHYHYAHNRCFDA